MLGAGCSPTGKPYGEGMTTHADASTPPAADDLLQFLVELAQNNEGTRIGLTLQMPGGTVTGILVGQYAWLDLLMAKEGWPHPEPNEETETDQPNFDDAVRKEFGLEVGGNRPDESNLLGADGSMGWWKTYRFIHLRDARLLVGGGSPYMAPVNGELLWRGRLSEVSGWWLGSLSSAPMEP
jgi:hypothetical protein